MASEGAEPVNGYCWSGGLIEFRKYRHAAVSGKCSESYLSGDIKAALREWKPLAKGGNAAAQFNLGKIYEREEAFQKITRIR